MLLKLRCLYQALTEARQFHRDELAVILAGQPGPLRAMLAAAPELAARFPVIVSFPGYTPAQLTAILTGRPHLTADAARKAQDILTRAETSRPSGNARLAVHLLTQATLSSSR